MDGRNRDMSHSSQEPRGAAVAVEASPGMLALLREALAGSQRDFTSESLTRAIFLLAIPMVLEMVMESIFAVVDIFWVSKLGPDAVAAVGITESMLSILYAVAVGLSM